MPAGIGMVKQPRVILTGGGSGGHVYPALAIAQIVASKFKDAGFLYVGTRRGAEAHILASQSVEIAYISLESFRGSRWTLPIFVARFAGAALHALGILDSFDPHLIVATGGYSSAPVVAAGYLRRKLRRSRHPKILLHEQNAVAGLANRFGGRLADLVAITFPSSAPFFPREKVIYAGYPVRAQLGTVSKKEARLSLGIPPDAFVVFAFGGSAGSRTINRGIVDSLGTLLRRDDLHVIHAVGRYRGSDYDPEKDTQERIKRILPFLEAGDRARRYSRLVYTSEIWKYYAAADLIVSRCGSGALFEIAKAGRPAILIPKADSAGGHQEQNARVMEKAGACLVLMEKQDPEEPYGVMKIDGGELARTILDLKDHPEKLAEMERSMKAMNLPNTNQIIGRAIENLLEDCTP